MPNPRPLLGAYFALAVCIVFSNAAWTQAPSGIASINLCVDQMLLRFAERGQISSLTYFADNPLMSPYADQAKGLHLNHGLVEELIPLAPRLILVGDYGAREAAELLTSLGFQIVRVPLPQNLAGIETHLTLMGELLGEPPALTAYAEQWQRRQAQLRQDNLAVTALKKPTVLMLGPNYIAPGIGTLEDELLNLAGFQNWAASQQLEGFATVNLEKLVQQPPDLLIVNHVAANQFSLAHEVLRHPALARALEGGRLASLPSNLSVCPAPNIDALISALVSLRESMSAKENS